MLTAVVAESNILTNITFTTTMPLGQPLGSTYLTASIFSLYGAASSPTLTDYALQITIANSTSSTEISTTDGTNACEYLMSRRFFETQQS